MKVHFISYQSIVYIIYFVEIRQPQRALEKLKPNGLN